MKIIFGFLLGLLSGALLASAVLLLNPFFDGTPAKTGRDATLAFTVAGQGAVSVLQTASGYPWVVTQPARAMSPAVEGSRSRVDVLLSSTRDADRVAYIVRVGSLSQAGRPLFGEVVEHSLWHVVMPDAGSFLVSADDDLWGFARATVVPLIRGDSWRGKLSFDTTVGPHRGRGELVGVSGDYAGVRGSTVYSQTLRRVSLANGVSDADATLYVNY